MRREATFGEIFLSRLAFMFYGKKIYKDFADRLPIEGGERALDFGSGSGGAAYYVLKRLRSGRLTCLDISKNWLKACRRTLRKFTNVDFLYGGAADLKQNGYDLIFCHFVLHDIPDGELETVIPNLVNALKPSGYLVFKEPFKDVGKLKTIRMLIEGRGLSPVSSRIADVPPAGSALESIYVKK
jgi:ubiquinone/menaquinone biosynthesis C-methylase UbiE